MKKMIRILVFVLSMFLALQNAYATKNIQKTVQNTTTEEQNTKADESNNIKVEDFDPKTVTVELEKIENLIKQNNFTRQNLDDNLKYLSDNELVLETLIRKLEKEQQYAQDALSAFGEQTETSDDQEDANITEMREKYTTAVNSYKNKLIEANLLQKEIERVKNTISEARNQMLIGNLVAEKNTIIVPKTFWNAISDAAVFFWRITILPIEWYKNLSPEERTNLYHKCWYALLIFGLSIALGIFFRSYIISHWGYGRKIETPGYGQKVMVAIVTALAYGVIPCLLVGGGLAWCNTYEDLIDSRFGKVLTSALFHIFLIIIMRAAARVVLAPWNGRWRLFNISDARAEKVFSATTLSFILLITSGFLRHIAPLFEPSDELKLLLEVGADAIRAFVIILLAVSVFGDIKSKEEDEADKIADTPETAESEKMSSRVRIILFSTIFALVTFSISLFGYPDLATFIFTRFYTTILTFGIFVVLRKMILDLLSRSIIFWVKTYRMRKRLLSKVDLLMSLLITPILIVLLTYMLLRLWGMPGSTLIYGIKKLIFGFKVGGIYISLIAILTGICVFAISITIVRMFRRKLSDNLLNRINMDEGIKHSLISGFSFIGVIISVILAISAMGVDLSNLAVIAGALSVGIGFGLQDIIKNLVSGIIILFERPFKVGDWVILAGEEGKIKQINIRSTELETWTKRSVIIPNATLISSSLINLTHGDNWQRQSIMVGVSYDSDAKRVAEVLLECAKSNKRVAKVPSPAVIFKDFGTSTLDFELRYHVADVRTDHIASSEIRYEILRRFREENIEIAFPQVVVHQEK